MHELSLVLQRIQQTIAWLLTFQISCDLESTGLSSVRCADVRSSKVRGGHLMSSPE